MARAGEHDDDYLPIAEHGLVGDLHSVALVGTNGTIDWYCCPDFDSPSVFGSILDHGKGGFYALRPTAGDWESKQLYFPDTNVLITRFFTSDGVGEVQDFMPIDKGEMAMHRHRLIRRVIVVRGRVEFQIELQPRFDYARAEHEVEMHPHGVLFRSPELSLALEGGIAKTMGHERTLERRGTGVHATFELTEGEAQTFVLERVTQDHICRPHSERETAGAFEATVAYWRSWVNQSRYTGRWRETVLRSALTLKLLTYAPTGALVAAPTTSLPESLGGVRNWDYRYAWLRDAAFTVYALMTLGFLEEAAAFMDWVQGRCEAATADRDIMIMYTVDGSAPVPELVLDHLAGYRGSKPVRIGNQAYWHRQLDVYGELMDSVYLYNREVPISYDLWTGLSRRLEWLADRWEEPDEGVWEVRGPRQRFTYSALMTWVAYDRAGRLARDRGLPAPVEKWRELAAQAYRFVQQSCWDAEAQAYVMHPGSKLLDASLLVMPM